MLWSNAPLTLYHGTDDLSVTSIRIPARPNSHGINLAYCRPLADFGRGFYTTTYLHQAKNWANDRCLRLRNAASPRQARATVLQFDVDRNLLGQLETLVFLRDDQAYWDFVQHCRLGMGPHHKTGNYDVAFGPVSLWPQTLVIKDCDQISFNTSLSLGILPAPTIAAQGTLTDPFLIVI